MVSRVGRPKEHGPQRADALLHAAEDIVEADGLDGLSVRRVAERVGTTTRAVYALFGSKDALVAALGRRAFEMLDVALGQLARTADPAADLVEASVVVFRRLAVEHPSLYRIAVQQTPTPPQVVAGFEQTAGQAWHNLRARVARLGETGALGSRPVDEATIEFHALCEGLAALELRGLLPTGAQERLWRDAIASLIAGFAAERAS